MAGDQDFEQEYEYFMRNKVHWLGNLAIDFHGDSETVECVCTRVLLGSKRSTKRKSAKGVNAPFNSHPIVDHITFPAPETPDRTLISNNDIGNINEILVDHSDENYLISDTENTSCCSLVKMVRSLQKRMRRRKKGRTPVDDKEKVEASTANQQPVAEPESVTAKAAAPDAVNFDNEDSPPELDSKSPENGVTHLGYAFEKPKSAAISQIHWDYDYNRIHHWNAPLTLQSNNKPELENAIDWWDADPEMYRTHVPTAENGDTDVSSEITEPSTRKRRKKKKAKKEQTNDPEMIRDDPEMIRGDSEMIRDDPEMNRDDPKMIRTKSEIPSTSFSETRMRITGPMPSEIFADNVMRKYWKSRYRLFSKFDEGIKLDRESWYSVTPEKVSQHIADRCRCDVIVDGFCGAGGNTIQFAFTCERVIAIDIDPKKIEMAKHNARIYGVYDRIEFIVGDFFAVIDKVKADVVFLSPPWGGPSYNQQSSFPLSDICPPFGGERIFKAARRVTDAVAFYLPRNIDTADLMPLGKKDKIFELEQNILTNKLVAVTAYFGNLVMKNEVPAALLD